MLNQRKILRLALTLILMTTGNISKGNEQLDFLTLDGNRKKLEGPIIINFWATWCAPCLKELPDLEALARNLAPDIGVYLVNIGELPETIKQFKEKKPTLFGSHAIILLDTEMKSMSLFELQGLPTTVLLNSDNQEIEKIQGIRPWHSEEMITFIKNKFTGL